MFPFINIIIIICVNMYCDAVVIFIIKAQLHLRVCVCDTVLVNHVGFFSLLLLLLRRRRFHLHMLHNMLSIRMQWQQFISFHFFFSIESNAYMMHWISEYHTPNAGIPFMATNLVSLCGFLAIFLDSFALNHILVNYVSSTWNSSFFGKIKVNDSIYIYVKAKSLFHLLPKFEPSEQCTRSNVFSGESEKNWK